MGIEEIASYISSIESSFIFEAVGTFGCDVFLTGECGRVNYILGDVISKRFDLRFKPNPFPIERGSADRIEWATGMYLGNLDLVEQIKNRLSFNAYHQHQWLHLHTEGKRYIIDGAYSQFPKEEKGIILSESKNDKETWKRYGLHRIKHVGWHIIFGDGSYSEYLTEIKNMRGKGIDLTPELVHMKEYISWIT